MPTSPTKTLSPAELAKLEHAFATDPASEAYKPLAEAYLGMGRFMEAMVVCKKGVKAHPAVPDPRVLLARVYAEQGKDKKAIEELMGALQVAPSDKQVLRMVGALQIKSGESDAGKGNLLKAFNADPNDAETRALLDQHKVEPPKADPPTERVPLNNGAAAHVPAAVAAAPAANAGAPVAMAPMAGPGAMSNASRGTRGAGVQPPPRASGAHPPPPPRETGQKPAPTNGANGNGAAAKAAGQAPAVRRTQERPARYEEDEEVSEPPRRARKGGGVTAALFVVAVLVVGGYYGLSAYRKKRNTEIKKQLNEASDQLRHDSYDSYRKASEAAKRALEVDSSSVAAHGYLAYAQAIIWGEHGGGDPARKLAEEHLEEAKSGGDVSSQMYAADALVKTYGGNGKQALTELEAKVKEFDAQGKRSSLLYLTLGLAQMNAGDLEHARESLEAAQQLAGGDARVYAALGALYRRRGEGEKAQNNFAYALRYERDHPESLLGESLLILDQDDPQYAPASKMLKKLLEMEPPPSPRQLATAHMARALLVSRVTRDLPLYMDEAFRKEVSTQTGVTGDKGKAQSEITREENAAFDLDRNNPELRLIKGRRLLLEGQVDSAVGEIREAIKMDASRAQSYVDLAKALMEKAGGEKDAIDALKTAMRTIGESPKLMFMLGQVYRKANRLDEALAEFEKAVRDPKSKNPDARMALGAIHFQKDALDKAREAFEKAAQEYVGQSLKVASAYTEVGRVWEKKGDKAKADDAFKKALNADPGYIPMYFFYGSFKAGDRKDAAGAKTLLEEYLKRDPKGPHADEAKKLVGGL